MIEYAGIAVAMDALGKHIAKVESDAQYEQYRNEDYVRQLEEQKAINEKLFAEKAELQVTIDKLQMALRLTKEKLEATRNIARLHVENGTPIDQQTAEAVL